MPIKWIKIQNCYTMPLHFSSASDSNSESLIFARCGLIMRPLLENTRSTGAELAEQHSTRSNRSVSCKYSDCRNMLSEAQSPAEFTSEMYFFSCCSLSLLPWTDVWCCLATLTKWSLKCHTCTIFNATRNWGHKTKAKDFVSRPRPQHSRPRPRPRTHGLKAKAKAKAKKFGLKAKAKAKD